MIQKTATSLALLLVLASCDKKQGRPVSDAGSESRSRTTRADRPRDMQSTRDKLRAALESAKAMEPGPGRDQAIAALAWKTLESNPALAALAIRELATGAEEKAALIEAYVRKLITEERVDEATAWADALDDARDVATARGIIALLLADAHPEQAAMLLPPSSFTAAGTDPAAEQVLNHWATTDPAAAVAWATRLPAGEARTTGLKMVFSRWIQGDSQAALDWTKSQNNPVLRKEALSAMIEAFTGQPEPIRSSLLESADPNLRAEIQQGIAEPTRTRTRTAARPHPNRASARARPRARPRVADRRMKISHHSFHPAPVHSESPMNVSRETFIGVLGVPAA